VRLDKTLYFELLPQNIGHVIGAGLSFRGVVLADGTTDRDPSEGGQHIKCGFEVVPAHVVEVHVESIVADHPVGLFPDGLRLIVHRCIKAVFLRDEFALFWPSCRAIYLAGTEQPGELAHGRAYRTSSAGDEYAFTLLELRDAGQPNVCGESGHAEQTKVEGEGSVL